MEGLCLAQGGGMSRRLLKAGIRLRRHLRGWMEKFSWISSSCPALSGAAGRAVLDVSRDVGCPHGCQGPLLAPPEPVPPAPPDPFLQGSSPAAPLHTETRAGPRVRGHHLVFLVKGMESRMMAQCSLPPSKHRPSFSPCAAIKS